MRKLQGDGGCFHGLKHLRTVLFDRRTSLQCKSGVLHSGHRRRCQRCQSVQGEQRQTAVGGRARQRGRQGEHFSGMPSSVCPSASAFGKDALARSPALLCSFPPKAPKTRCTESAWAKTGCGRLRTKVAKGHIANSIFGSKAG